MKKIRKVLLSLVVGMGSLLGTSSCAAISNITKNQAIVYEESSSYSIGNFTYSKDDVDAIEVHWFVGHITLITSNQQDLSVSESAKSLLDEQKMHYLISNRTLKIQFWESDLTGKIKESEKNLRFEIPSGVDIKVFNCSGHIKSSYINAKNLELQTVSGDIEFDSVTAESLKVDTVSGDVELDQVSVPTIAINSVSGKVELDLVSSSRIDIDTVSGKVEFELKGLGATINFDTVSGKYRAPNNAKTFGDGSCQINVETTSGSLKVSESTNSNNNNNHDKDHDDDDDDHDDDDDDHDND